MAENQLLVRNAVFSVKTKTTSVSGDITIQEMNAIMTELLAQGYKVISANAYSGDQESAQIYVCMVMQ